MAMSKLCWEKGWTCASACWKVAFGSPADELDHARRQVHSQCRSGGGAPGGVSGRLPAAAADVEHGRGLVYRRCGEELAAVCGDCLIEAVGVVGPEGTRIAIPVAELFGVGRVDQLCGAHRHRVEGLVVAHPPMLSDSLGPRPPPTTG